VIERELAARLAARRAGAPEAPAGTDGSAREVDVDDGGGVEPAGGSGIAVAGLTVCAACGTTNDADARFCKGCGSRLAAQASSAGSHPPLARGLTP
jgi:hypothetical protein